jgi:hypothetical protein
MFFATFAVKEAYPQKDRQGRQRAAEGIKAIPAFRPEVHVMAVFGVFS